MILNGLPRIHVSNLKYWKNPVAVAYSITSVPQNVSVAPSGKTPVNGHSLYLNYFPRAELSLF